MRSRTAWSRRAAAGVVGRKHVSKVRVPIYGAHNKVALLDTAATRGATIGVDLMLPDGRVATLADLAGRPPATPLNSLANTIWSRVGDIPPNVRQVEMLDGAGLVTRLADGDWITREIEVGSTDRLVISQAAGATGNPVIDLSDVPALSVWARDANSVGKPSAVESADNETLFGRDDDALGFLGASDVLDWVGDNAGDLLYRSAGGWEALPAATDGQVLRLASGVPAWDDIEFLDLDDTPGDYTGAGDWFVRVAGSADGLEFVELGDVIFLDVDDFGDLAFEDDLAFSDLTDVPAYTGAGGFALRVAATEDAIEFAQLGELAFEDVSFLGDAAFLDVDDFGDLAWLDEGDLSLFTSSVQGVVPSSGGGTTNFLRADGSWAAPPGGGGASAFTDLSDTPGSITTNGFVRGNAGGTALEFLTEIPDGALSSNIARRNAPNEFAGAQTIQMGSGNALRWRRTDAAANLGNWQLAPDSAGTMRLQRMSDAWSFIATALEITSSTTATTGITLGEGNTATRIASTVNSATAHALRVGATTAMANTGITVGIVRAGNASLGLRNSSDGVEAFFDTFDSSLGARIGTISNHRLRIMDDAVTVAITAAPAGGGFQANNQVTGGGLERVLTTSDQLIPSVRQQSSTTMTAAWANRQTRANNGDSPTWTMSSSVPISAVMSLQNAGNGNVTLSIPAGHIVRIVGENASVSGAGTITLTAPGGASDDNVHNYVLYQNGIQGWLLFAESGTYSI